MKAAKLVLAKPDGTRVWINLFQVLKMEKLPNGRFYLFLINGEVFEINLDSARIVEKFLEDFED